MQKYKAILFDLDDTLIDNDESCKYAIFNLYEKFGIPCTNETFLRWKQFDIDYWIEWENGTFIFPSWINSQHQKIDFLRYNRFYEFFKEFNITHEEAESLNSYYISLLHKNIIPIDGAHEVLEELSKSHELVISTNGPKEAAFKKVKAANLHMYINKIVASGECGFSKPMPSFFRYVISKMNTKDRSQMLIIGDSLKSDILGGIYNGIDSCWFNPEGKENTLGMDPTYEIKHLKQLIKK